MDIYKFAARKKLRFPSTKGELTVEQLYDLPLKTAVPGGLDLDTVARTINTWLKGASEESFVPDESPSPERERMVTALEVVKDVIATKQAENKAATTRREKAKLREKIQEAIAAKKDEQITKASLEDLYKQLDALND